MAVCSVLCSWKLPWVQKYLCGESLLIADGNPNKHGLMTQEGFIRAKMFDHTIFKQRRGRLCLKRMKLMGCVPSLSTKQRTSPCARHYTGVRRCNRPQQWHVVHLWVGDGLAKWPKFRPGLFVSMVSPRRKDNKDNKNGWSCYKSIMI